MSFIIAPPDSLVEYTSVDVALSQAKVKANQTERPFVVYEIRAVKRAYPYPMPPPKSA